MPWCYLAYLCVFAYACLCSACDGAFIFTPMQVFCSSFVALAFGCMLALTHGQAAYCVHVLQNMHVKVLLSSSRPQQVGGWASNDVPCPLLAGGADVVGAATKVSS